MSKASGFIALLAGAGIAVCTASGTDTGGHRRSSPELLTTGSTSLAALRQGATAEEHQQSPPSPAAAMVLPQRPDEPAVRVPIVRPEPGSAPPRDRDALTRALQRELRRLGCYAGQINGAWTSSTRTAMKTFTDRVNAKLPMAQPDPVLLALARSHQDMACIQRCPSAHGLAQPGQCPSSTTLAQTAAVASSTTTAATPQPTSAPSPSNERMAVTGPRAAAVPGRGRPEANRVPPRPPDFARTIFARMQAHLP